MTMGSASQFVEITSAFNESQRSTSAASTTASLALPMRWCRASFAATVCWRAARRWEYSVWGCGKIASVGRGLVYYSNGCKLARSMGRFSRTRIRACVEEGLEAFVAAVLQRATAIGEWRDGDGALRCAASRTRATATAAAEPKAPIPHGQDGRYKVMTFISVRSS